jgi:DNA-binding beta-propeller fold protein YncE
MRRSLVGAALLFAGLGSALSLASCADILGIGSRQLEEAGVDGGGGPTTLAEKINEPVRLVADTQGENLYWTVAGNTATNGGVFTYNIASGKVRPVVQGLATPTDMAIDADSLYWINAGAGQIVRCALASGCASTTILKSAEALGIAVDATSLYWVDTGGSLHKANKTNGSNETTLAGRSDGLGLPDACFVDTKSGDLFLSDPGEDGGLSSVWRLSNKGSGLVQVQPSAGCPCRFTSSPEEDYWTNYFNAVVSGLARSGSTPATVVTAQNGPERVFYDPSGNALYVANLGSGQKGNPDGTIVRASTDGHTLTNLAANLEQPIDLVVVGPYVYYLTWGTISSVTMGRINFAPSTGTLVRVPK